jgi:MtN3 and saliva related transmembrane protein
MKIMDHASFIEAIGIGAGTCTAIALLPQLIKLIKEKKAESISVFYLVILFTGLCLWIWYGFMRHDVPVILTNIVSLIINIMVMIFSIRYKQKQKN